MPTHSPSFRDVASPLPAPLRPGARQEERSTCPSAPLVLVPRPGRRGLPADAPSGRRPHRRQRRDGRRSKRWKDLVELRLDIANLRAANHSIGEGADFFRGGSLLFFGWVDGLQ